MEKQWNREALVKALSCEDVDGYDWVRWSRVTALSTRFSTQDLLDKMSSGVTKLVMVPPTSDA